MIPLRPYQEEGVLFLRTHRGTILADEMGLGKTRQALQASLGLGRLLICCPAHVRGVWRDELDKWLPNHGAVFECKTRKAVPIGAAIVLCHYDVIDAWKEHLAAWRPECIILDEAHALTNERTLRSKAVRFVCTSAHFRWALTGTPLTNRPRDLWNVVDTIKPRFLGSFFQYARRYCNAHQVQVTPMKMAWDFNGSSNLEELHQRLQAVMLRRTKEEVALQLPSKTRQVLRVDVPFVGAHDAENLHAVRLALSVMAERKFEHALEVIRAHLEAGKRVVAFTYHRVFAQQLAGAFMREGYNSLCIIGGDDEKKRAIALTSLRNASSGLLAATINSTSTGIDLTFGDVAVFVELTYEPAKLLQAEARLHRFGRHDPVLIQYLVGRGSIDEVICQRVIEKLDTFDAVMGDGAGERLQSTLGAQSADELMGELYKALGFNLEETSAGLLPDCAIDADP